jgi:bifunctional non-homologous end joining protein LigD
MARVFAFGLLELDGQDLRREPLLTRKSTLLSLLKGASAGIVYNEHMRATAR